MPRSLPADGASLLVVAVSGRALAASARRAGFVPLVADFFADTDTRQITHSCCKLDDLKGGFRWKAIAPALEALAEAAPSSLLGVVYGAGFEDRIALLAKIAERWPLLGNGPSAVARVKAPEIFFAELARLGIPHPGTVMDPAAAGIGWLAKRQGGAGGSHIVGNHAAMGRKAAGRSYFQEKVEGRPVSALFISSGTGSRVFGFSEQWATPSLRSKWRYGGAARPAELSRDLEARLTESVELVASSFGLKGLGSADFLVNGEDSYLLEINPRPGATLDIFDSEATPLLRIHAEAVLHNRLPTAPLNLPAATASAIVYATEPITVSQAMVWPDWTADRPNSAERIDKDRPICTVWARSRTKVEARRLVEKRISIILAACASREGGT
ncbi:MAG TPA: ATP-grasp domain-containing protein [Methyloceanibacter sp.]|nr:ATP-grasp domain-containing protein [Methyloceanibacter sp.]